MTLPSTKLLLAGMSAVALAAPALKVAPVYHNFGEVGVMGLKTRTFTTTLPPGVTQGTLTYSVVGPDAIDFLGSGTQSFGPNIPPSSCRSGPQGVVCEWVVEFRPRSIGPKRADLAVTDNLGNSTTAALEGEAVAALCTNRVVFCNYAHHYSGVVSWQGGDSHGNVDVVAGVASCNAAAFGESGGMTSGPGLIAVEFDRSTEPSERRSLTFYRITAACPIHYVSEPPMPDRPAELGHDELNSYKQPLGMTIAEAQAKLPRLRGSDGEVSWDLCPNSEYQPAVRKGDSRSQGRCPPTP